MRFCYSNSLTQIFTSILIVGLWSCGPKPASIISLEPYVFRNGTDSIQAEIGLIEVPLNRESYFTQKIGLAFMKIKGLSQENSNAIFYLEGGPGAAAIKSSRFELYKKLSEAGDVIVLDQRGTGLSEQDLNCPVEIPYPQNQPITPELLLELEAQLAEECRSFLRKNDVDLKAYNSIESAHDINDLREQLGYEKISLVGMSYGSHLGLAVIRYFGEHVANATLAGVEGYDHTYKLPSTFDTHLTFISNLIRADSVAGKEFPNFESFVYRKALELQRQPVEVSIDVDGKTEKIIVTSFLFKRFVAGMIGRKEFIASVISDFKPIKEDDYSEFAHLIRRSVRSNIVGVCMDCASGMSQQRKTYIQEDAPYSYFTEVVNFPFPGICEIYSIEPLPEHYRDTIQTDIPVLFISGTLDGRTPLENVKNIEQGFSNRSFIMVHNMGHNTNGLFLQAEGVMETVNQFILGYFNGRVLYQTEPVQFH